MSKRNEKISFKLMPNGNIRGFQNDTKKSGISEWQIINPNNLSPTIIAGNTPKVIIYEK